jgi:hypothetical protein
LPYHRLQTTTSTTSSQPFTAKLQTIFQQLRYLPNTITTRILLDFDDTVAIQSSSNDTDEFTMLIIDKTQVNQNTQPDAIQHT